MIPAKRSPWRIALSVWQALFLREAVGRITADRIAWLWILAEPIAHVLLMVWVRSLLGRIRIIPGAEFIPWLVVGITTFIMFRNLMNRGMEAVTANRALFAYRQVMPVDTVIARCGLEGALSFSVLLLLVSVFTLIGFHLLPHNPLAALHVLSVMFMFGLGIALVFSVVVTSLPESAKFIRMVSFPLYILSGVIFPVQYFPHDLVQYLLYNPLLHGVELMRLEFFETYRSVHGISLLYLYYWAAGSLFLGLAMHIRFRQRLLSQ